MGRFNWIWRALWTLSVLVCASLIPGLGYAFDMSDDAMYNPEEMGTPGNCTVFKYMTHGDGRASVYINNKDSGLTYYAGAGEYFGGTWYPGNPAITKTTIADCFNLTAGEVSSFTDNSGLDEDYETDNYVGFSFTLSVEFDGKAAGFRHEFKVGAGTYPVAEETPEQTLEQTQKK
jgi:hypothetical protein